VLLCQQGNEIAFYYTGVIVETLILSGLLKRDTLSSMSFSCSSPVIGQRNQSKHRALHSKAVSMLHTFLLSGQSDTHRLSAVLDLAALIDPKSDLRYPNFDSRPVH
jgi:hypothetical protein